MSTYYGSWISTDDWRAVMDVTTSTSNTSVSFTVVGKCESVYAYSTSWKGTLTSNGSGGTNSKTFECSTNQTVSFKTNTFSVSRGTSAKTVTVKCAVYNGNYGETSTAKATITVPAKPSYTVSYNANNGSGAPNSQTKWYGETLTLSSTKPTRTGYTFQGWGTSSTTSTVSYAAGASYTDNAALSLYAVWKANTYTVSFDANGGSGAPANQTKTYGVTLTLSSTKPTRTGYTFLGWSTSSTATSATYTAGGNYTANSSAKLYAVWKIHNTIHVYNSSGKVKQGIVTVYSSTGTAHTCIITVYDANGKAKSAQ